MPSLTTKIAASIAAELLGSAAFDAPRSTPALGKDISLANGTGADQADIVWAAQRTLAPAASENLDLAGTFTDVFGKTVNLARVKAIIVRTARSNQADVVVGGAASNAFAGPLGGTTPTVSVRTGGVFMAACHDATGWPVTAGTGDLLKVANASSTAQAIYDIMIVGASA